MSDLFTAESVPTVLPAPSETSTRSAGIGASEASTFPSDNSVLSARIGSNGPTAHPSVPPKMFENGPKSAHSPEPHEPLQLSTASIVSVESTLVEAEAASTCDLRSWRCRRGCPSG